MFAHSMALRDQVDLPCIMKILILLELELKVSITVFANERTSCLLRFRELKEQRLHESQLHNGQQSPAADEEEPEMIRGLDAGMWQAPTLLMQETEAQDVTTEPIEDSKAESFEVEEGEGEDGERSRNTEETNHKCRSKRESRRMRELEQAQFSLELLKVRTTSVAGSLSEEPIPDSASYPPMDHHHHQPPSSPRGSPTSHGSFELLSAEEVEGEGPVYYGYAAHPPSTLRDPEDDVVILRSAIHIDPQPQPQRLNEGSPNLMAEMSTSSSSIMEESPRATFYISPEKSISPQQPSLSESPSKPLKERRASTSRRPVVVVISMQKETQLDEGEMQAVQARESEPQMGVSIATSPMTPTTPCTVSEVAAEKEQMSRTVTQPQRDLEERSTLVPSTTHGAPLHHPGLCPSEVGIQIVLEPKALASEVLPTQEDRMVGRPLQGGWASPTISLESRGVVTKASKAQKKTPTQTISISMTEKPTNVTFSPPRRKLPFSK